MSSASNPSRPRVAVVGVGHLGKHHMRLLGDLDCDLVGVADPSEEARAFAAETYSLETYADYRELADKVDAVSVVVPTKLHREVGCYFLERGVDVLVEKPIARSVEDGQALVDAAAANDRVLAVGHVERFNPALRGIETIGKAARYIESHRLAPFSFRSTDIGVVLDLMIHDLDLVLALPRTDPPVSPHLRGHETAVQHQGNGAFRPTRDRRRENRLRRSGFPRMKSQIRRPHRWKSMMVLLPGNSFWAN